MKMQNIMKILKKIKICFHIRKYFNDKIIIRNKKIINLGIK